ncbi:MAG TPA: lysine--tRNA ligase, partial [Pseudolysinimonas sp.]|nr:lysine--tRNA ligase [Pseudolysinimonas sp.]
MSDEQPPEPPSETEVAEQKAVRLAKRERLIAEDGDAYPVGVPVTHTIPQLRERWADLKADDTT